MPERNLFFPEESPYVEMTDLQSSGFSEPEGAFILEKVIELQEKLKKDFTEFGLGWGVYNARDFLRDYIIAKFNNSNDKLELNGDCEKIYEEYRQRNNKQGRIKRWFMDSNNHFSWLGVLGGLAIPAGGLAMLAAAVDIAQEGFMTANKDVLIAGGIVLGLCLLFTVAIVIESKWNHRQAEKKLKRDINELLERIKNKIDSKNTEEKNSNNNISTVKTTLLPVGRLDNPAYGTTCNTV